MSFGGILFELSEVGFVWGVVEEVRGVHCWHLRPSPGPITRSLPQSLISPYQSEVVNNAFWVLEAIIYYFYLSIIFLRWSNLVSIVIGIAYKNTIKSRLFVCYLNASFFVVVFPSALTVIR